MNKRIFEVLMVCFLAAWALFTQTLKAATLENVLTIALKENPELKSLEAKVKAGKSRIKSSASLPDPWIGLEYEEIPQGTLKFGAAGMKMYTFSQMVPWLGKLSLRGKVSQSQADIIGQDFEKKRREIIAGVKQAYFELYFAYKAIEVTKENIQLLGQMSKVAERKYSVGKASLAEALKAQVELSKLDNHLISLENQRQTVQAKLNVLLGRKPEEEIGPPEYQEVNEFNYALPELYQIAQNNRPELKAARTNINQSNLKLALSKREYWPDFMFTYKQRVMSGEATGWDGMFNVTIPLWFWQNQNYMVKEMERELEMTEADYKAMENMVFFEVKQMFLKLDSSQRQVRLYEKTIIPQTEQVLKVSQREYETDRMEFLDFLDSQRMYLETKLDYYMNLADFQMGKAELEQMTGTDLSEVKK